MANPTRNMLLQMWDQINDLWFNDTLADNFERIDKHDHSGGRGVQIPTEGIADGAITLAKLGADVSDPHHKEVFAGFSSFNFARWEPPGNSAFIYLVESGTGGTGGNFALYRFDPDEWGVTVGASNKLKIDALVVGDNPGGDSTFGLWPVTSIANGQPMLGTAVHTFTVPSPGASRISRVASGFSVPAAGYYVLGVSVYDEWIEEIGVSYTATFRSQLLVKK